MYFIKDSMYRNRTIDELNKKYVISGHLYAKYSCHFMGTVSCHFMCIVCCHFMCIVCCHFMCTVCCHFMCTVSTNCHHRTWPNRCNEVWWPAVTFCYCFIETCTKHSNYYAHIVLFHDTILGNCWF